MVIAVVLGIKKHKKKRDQDIKTSERKKYLNVACYWSAK